MQFHPTALKHPSMPRPLLSEALRGEGAVLRDNDGKAFMADIHLLADLAPRECRGTRSTSAQATGAEIWLDATMIDDFRHRFPDDLDGVHTRRPGSRTGLGFPLRRPRPLCRAVSSPISTVPRRCRGCGRAARPRAAVYTVRTGSPNPLLDGLVFGRRVINAMAGGKQHAVPTGAMHGVLGLDSGGAAEPDPVVLPKSGDERHAARRFARQAVQRVMSTDCGVIRDADGLRLARRRRCAILATLAEDLPARTVATYEVCNAARAARDCRAGNRPSRNAWLALVATIRKAPTRLAERCRPFRRRCARRRPAPSSRYSCRGLRGQDFVAHSWPKRRLDDWLNHAAPGAGESKSPANEAVQRSPSPA